jgi:ABC-type bacteriocin/lantibiotic exporter with double-glycine peptidase domain
MAAASALAATELQAVTLHATLLQLAREFPALRRLGAVLRPEQVPVVLQLTATDCGAASLAMSLAFHGRSVPLPELRECMAIGRDGVTAQAILETAALYDLRGRGVRVEVSDLGFLPKGSILHWAFSHFVVFVRVDTQAVHIVDPAVGRRAVPLAEARRLFTGVALVLERSDAFVAAKPGDNPVQRHLKAALAGSDDWHRIALVSILLELLALLSPLVNGSLIDHVLPRSDTHLLWVLIALMATTVVFHFAATVTRGQLLLQLRTGFDAKMTFGFIEHLLRLPYGFFERRHAADLQLRVASIATIREMLTGAVLSASIDGVLVCCHLGLLALTSLKMTAVALVVVSVQVLAYIATRHKLMELASGSVIKQAEAASALNELLAGMESLKACGHEQKASQSWAARYVDVMNIGLRQGNLSAFSQALLNSLQVMGPMALMITGVTEVLNHDVQLGVMLSANSLAVGFLHPMMNLAGTLQQLQTTRVHLTRIDDVLGTAQEQKQPGKLRQAPRLAGQISLERVSFRYGPKLDLAVRDVSVEVRPGECIAIVGRSGSGKTTLGRLLLGLYEPTQGQVALDGIPLSQLELRSVRRQFGVVTQKPHIFGTTIRANIALADPELPLARVRAAAHRACIDEDITRMSMQYDTPVVAAGASLSGGQRQRIALARALLDEPAVLLLDEATSALDSITEAAVQAQLDALQCTRIYIAHRLSTVVSVDRILVMENGQLVEQGTHAELLAKNGAYARLIAAQLASSAPARAPDITPAPVEVQHAAAALKPATTLHGRPAPLALRYAGQQSHSTTAQPGAAGVQRPVARAGIAGRTLEQVSAAGAGLPSAPQAPAFARDTLRDGDAWTERRRS